ncbi:MAG: glycerate kinase type-2 family protein [Steroidobacteraceae bacterium]
MAASGDPRRDILLGLLRVALDGVDGRRCTSRALSARVLSGRALCGDARRARSGDAPVWAVAIGKAASRMALGAHDALGAALERTLIITKDGHADAEAIALPGVEIRECGHPVPDRRSLDAGARLLEFLDEMPAAAWPVFLVSGGASSLVEVLAPGVSLAALRALNEAGLAGGSPIDELNAQRRRLSRIKGGQLASLVKGRRALALLMSDVPHNDPAVIGSGLLGPAPPGAEPLDSSAAGGSRPAGIPRGSRSGAAADDVERIVVASLDDALGAVRARVAGLPALVETERFCGAVSRLAVRFAHEIALGPAELRAWGGESTLELPREPGCGGRNQHLALAAARLIAGRDDLLLLAAGTDGTDGPTADAGALVDGGTCGRVAAAGLDVDDCLRRADSSTALAAAGDLVHTGPTGTNVGDLVIGVKLPKATARAWLRARPEP